jgi:Reverse transcriptase (RNA-dependent DNA polymerase)
MCHCTTVGEYEYLRLPMGLSISPDILQKKMIELMAGLEFPCPYLDDLLILSTEKGFDKHLEKMEQVLKGLHKAGLKINDVKSFFV